jgi:hypothetical protein
LHQLAWATLEPQPGSQTVASAPLPRALTGPQAAAKAVLFEGSSAYIPAPEQYALDQQQFTLDVAYLGTVSREVFDIRRPEDDQFVVLPLYAYDVVIGGAFEFEFLVNQELPRERADDYVDVVTQGLSHMPTALLVELETVVLHGSGETDNVVATGSPQLNRLTLWEDPLIEVVEGNYLLNILAHELAHVGVDEYVEETPAWQAAQEADSAFISEYARDNPDLEDVAETFGIWIASRYYGDAVTPNFMARIASGIGRRLDYLNTREWDMFPADDRFAPGGQITVRLEEPLDNGVHSGVGNLRGWAVATDGIARVGLYINGEYAGEAPYGGLRGDVEQAFPDAKDGLRSGFSLAFNYGELGSGRHSLTVKAFGVDGNLVAEDTAQFTVVAFNQGFIGIDEVVDLQGATLRLEGNDIVATGAEIAGVSYTLRLRWRTAEQGFEIIQIAP